MSTWAFNRSLSRTLFLTIRVNTIVKYFENYRNEEERAGELNLREIYKQYSMKSDARLVWYYYIYMKNSVLRYGMAVDLWMDGVH